MPVVTVEWLEGRTPQQKSTLTHAITQAFVEIARVSKDQVWIVFRDVKRADWAMGGQLLENNSPR
ncbi:MAG: tautomerase family protein [Candidatus Omnitrophica bacterium]|nr:tautomerase family protein [Candidatus Omnitrophota bacterium]